MNSAHSMNTSLHAAPVARDRFAPAMHPSAHAGVRPSACPPGNNSAIGQCFDHNGPVPGKFNCAACCALRGAVGWHDPVTGAVINC